MTRCRGHSLIVLAAGAFLAVASAAVAVEQTVVLQMGLDGYSGVADTNVETNDWDTPPQYTVNYGQNEVLHLDRDGGANVLIRFDLSAIPANSAVRSATLEPYNTTDSSGHERQIEAFRVLVEWDEGNQVASSIDGPGKHGATGDDALDYWTGEGTDLPWHARGLEAGTDYDATVLDEPSYCSGTDGAIAMVLAEIRSSQTWSTQAGDIALVYDWCHDELSQTDRDTILDSFATVTSDGDDIPGWDNYWPRWGYSFAFMGLAALGEAPDARSWMDEFREDRFGAYDVENLHRIAGGGGWPEGTVYDWIANLWRVKAAAGWRTATGENLFEATAWFRERLAYLPTLWLPGTADSWGHLYHPYIGHGDAERNRGPMADYGRIMAEILVEAFPDDPDARPLQGYLAAPPRPVNDFENTPWGEWRLELEPADTGLEHGFLTVILPDRTGRSAPPATTAVSGTGVEGVLVRWADGADAVLFSATDDGEPLPGTVEYTVPGTVPVRHTVLDAPPGSRWSRTITNSLGTVTVALARDGAGELTATETGILRFTTPGPNRCDIIVDGLCDCRDLAGEIRALTDAWWNPGGDADVDGNGHRDGADLVIIVTNIFGDARQAAFPEAGSEPVSSTGTGSGVQSKLLLLPPASWRWGHCRTPARPRAVGNPSSASHSSPGPEKGSPVRRCLPRSP